MSTETEQKFTFTKDESDPLKDKYGVLPFIVSNTPPEHRLEIHYDNIKDLNDTFDGKTVKLRVRLQRSRIKGKGGFIVLRDGVYTIQGCLFVTEGVVSKQMINFVNSLHLESIVDVEAKVKKAEKPVESCTQKDIELDITSIFLVIDATNVLPFQMEDACRKVNPELEEDDYNAQQVQEAKKDETEKKDEKKEDEKKEDKKEDEKKEETEKKEDKKEDEKKEETEKKEEKEEDKKEEDKKEENEKTAEQKKLDKKAEKERKKQEKKAKKEEHAKKKAETQQHKEKGEKKDIVVKMKTRLDNRVMDLRVPTTQAIFKVQSGVCHLFREFLDSKGFTEIHTPKLIAGASEGGANVFKMKYFGTDACLAQSPQLYKQMCIIGDMKKVYEIGAVFRAENSMTSRHLCEFTGLDFEMEIKEHYFEVLDVIGELFYHIFEGLNKNYKKEIETVNSQYPFEPLVYSKEALKLDFKEGCKLLEENGYHQSINDDLDTENEKQLGRLVKEKYNTDFYILYGYPKSARPFYTMPDPHTDFDSFTNSYDAFIRGEEVLSGAQRIHDYDLLLKKVNEKGINPSTLKDYLDSFKLGAPPHGGAGIGLERVVKLFLGIKNIKKCVMFPRDPKRLTP
jgi:aspartyl-tRNA synthetase